ncbi:MAG: PAS domain S-box protein, partial [Kiloniellales bacterium]
MRPRHLVYLAALTVLLVFALTAAWEFVLEDLLITYDGPRNPAWESTQEHWTYVLTATLAAAAAWLVSGLVSLRLVARNDRAKRDLEEGEDLFRQAADMARLGHYIWDEREGRRDYCSEELARLFGYTVAEYLAKYDGLDATVENVHPEDRARYEEAWRDSMESRQPYDVEYRALTAKGDYSHFREQGRSVIDERDRVLRWIGVVQDINEPRRAAEALRESEVRLRAMMDHAPFEISIKDTNGRYLLVNGQYERNYGRPKDAFEGKTPLDLFPEDFSRVYAAHDRKVLETGEAVQVEATVPLEDGVHTFMSTKFPIRDVDGKIASIGSISIDITKRKLAEQALRHARDELELRVKERTRELQQANRKLTQENAERRQVEDALRRNEASLAEAQRQARIGSWRWSVERDALISCSDEYARIHGVDTSEIEDLLAGQMERVVHPDDRERVEAEFKRFDEEGVDYEIEYRIVRPDGEVRHVLEIGEAVRDETGRAVEQIGTLQDITERKRAEEALRVSQARFAGILDIAPEAIISIDEEQNIRLFNKGAEAIFGYPADEVLGHPLEMLLPPRYRAAHPKHMEDFARAPEVSRLMGSRADVVGLRKDGTEFPAKASISKLMHDGEAIYTVSL